MKKTNYGTIVLMVIGLVICVGCSQVSFNNPFGESEPARTNVDTADNTSDNQDASSDNQTDKSKPTEYKIHYLNAKNADNPNKTSFLQTDTIVLQDVSADGFTFDGWYEVTDNIADTSTDGWNAGERTNDVTLWAKWSAVNNDPTDPVMPAAKVYTIRFDNNDGSGTMSDITADVGQITVLPACTIVPPVGKKFGSWNGKADGSGGISYADGASVKNLSETDGEAVTLYAQWIDKDAHRIIYHNTNNADNSLNPTSFKESESVMLTDVAAIGYSFGGWYDSSSDGNLVESWNVGERTDDVTLWAKWTANEVTYTVKRYFQTVSGDGYDASADIVKSGLTDEVTDVTADIVPGYTALPIVQQSIAADGSTVVSVYYDRKVVVYTFNANGGKWDDESNVKKAVGLYGAEVETTANPSRVGYSFNNWDAEVPTVFGETAETWTAQWTANTYTIVFDANGGTGTMNSMDMTYGTAKTLTANSFTKTGYTFLGWSDSSSDISAQYTNSQSISNLTTGSGEIVTLYAIWKANTYNVVFNANGGSGVMANQVMTYDTTANLNTNAFYRTGYTFQGWAISASGAKVYNNAASVSNLSSTSGGTYNLYAKWTAHTYTVKFNNNGGFGSMSNLSMTYGTAKALTANSFVRTYYIFKEWNTAADGSGMSYTDKKSVKNLTAENGVTVTLYAVWKGVWHIGDGGNFACGDTVYVNTGMKPVLSGDTVITGSGSTGVFPSARGSVTLGKYAIGKYPVTQQLFNVVMGINPSYFTANQVALDTTQDIAESNSLLRPVDSVDWYDAITFCNKLSLLVGKTPCYTVSGVADWETLTYSDIPTNIQSNWNSATCDWSADGYRLPTECEWECAARGGSYSAGTPWTYTYSGSNTVGDVAWNTSNSSSHTWEVGLKSPNNLGLYDMSGNVWEWCWDNYIDTITNSLPVTGSNSVSLSKQLRGGAYNTAGLGCTVYIRSQYDSEYLTWLYGNYQVHRRYRQYGFRIAKNIE